VGAWCFVDQYGPTLADDTHGIEIGPHPHIGLATATWLFRGSVQHSDSLGTEQLIRPGELNLMTAGRGIAHAELGIEAPDGIGVDGVVGAQMWLALPESTRLGGSQFEHHEDLPTVDLGPGEAHIIAGAFGQERSPARMDHPAVGLDVSFRGAIDIPLERSFEHGVVPIDRAVMVEDAIVEPGSLALVPAGLESIRIQERSGSARFLLLGGEPFGVEIKMWWNFVARTFDEITQAWRAWRDHDDEWFGPVPSRLARVEAPRPPWMGRRS
jgi:hypothetical protein